MQKMLFWLLLGPEKRPQRAFLGGCDGQLELALIWIRSYLADNKWADAVPSR